MRWCRASDAFHPRGGRRRCWPDLIRERLSGFLGRVTGGSRPGIGVVGSESAGAVLDGGRSPGLPPPAPTPAGRDPAGSHLAVSARGNGHAILPGRPARRGPNGPTPPGPRPPADVRRRPRRRCPSIVKEALAELEEEGIVLRDPNRGLIDFPALHHSGREVLLCWQLGEDDLEWWHLPEDGFAGRRPLPLPPELVAVDRVLVHAPSSTCPDSGCPGPDAAPGRLATAVSDRQSVSRLPAHRR